MLEETHRFVCDLCGEVAIGEAPEFPPPGFAILKVRPARGVGVVVHLCLDGCLPVGAERLADGRTVEGLERSDLKQGEPS